MSQKLRAAVFPRGSNGISAFSSDLLPKRKYKKNDSEYFIKPLLGLSKVHSLLVVAITASICYANSIYGSFVFDDSEAIINNEDLRSENSVWNIFYNDFWGTRLTHKASHKSYRPLTVLSFRWNYWLGGGLKPWNFHFTNIVLHVGVSTLSTFVYNILFGKNNWNLAILSSLMFSIHPVHTEAVAGVVGRADLLCTLFFFLSFLVYSEAMQQKTICATTSYVFLSMLLCAMAMLCKEQGITVIGLCSAYDLIINMRSIEDFFRKILVKYCVLFDKSTWRDVKQLIYRHMILLFTGLILLIFRWKIMDSSPPVFQKVDNPASFADSFIVRVLSYNYIYALNLWLLLCPEWLCFDWSMGCIPLLSMKDLRITVVLTFWISLLIFSWKCWSLKNARDRRNVMLAVCLTIIPFLPATNLFFRVGFVIAERVLYLPSAGYCMLVITGFQKIIITCSSKWIVKFSFYVLLISFGVRGAIRSAEWTSESTLFKSGLSVCPQNAKVHYNIAKNEGDAGNKEIAVAEYHEALRLNPDYGQAMNNLANILKDEGKLIEAESLLRRAVQLRPDFAAAWMNLGIVMAGLKRYDEAEACYFMALEHRHKYPDCYYNLGNLYLEQKAYDKAYNSWRNATALKPTHTVAWNNMIIMLDNTGDAVKAEQVAIEALNVLPNEPSLHFNLANTLGKAGRFLEAEKHFSRAISLDATNAVYYTNLGVLYHRWKKYDKAEAFYGRALQINPKLESALDNLALLLRTLNKIKKQS